MLCTTQYAPYCCETVRETRKKEYNLISVCNFLGQYLNFQHNSYKIQRKKGEEQKKNNNEIISRVNIGRSLLTLLFFRLESFFFL